MATHIDMIAIRARADSDQMWETLRARSDEIDELHNQLKMNSKLKLEDRLLLTYLVSALMCEIKFKNLERIAG